MQNNSEIIPLAVPHLAGNEWAYIKDCLDTNWVSYVGPYVDRFERELAAKVGASHAVAVSSGTAALHIALHLAGVGQDDEVVMPGLTFVAPANAVRYCGAWPVFSDIRPDDWQWDVGQVATFLDSSCAMRDGKLVNKATGRRIAALMPVHLLGGICDVDAVADLAARYELPLIEDAAECPGAAYKNRPIGAAIPGFKGPFRLVITSFNGNKIITTGGGGAIFAEDSELATHAKHLTTTAKSDRIEFVHDEVGYNYRLTNIAAALGVAQLEMLDSYVDAKRTIAERYRDAFFSMPIDCHPEPVDCTSTYWMYTIAAHDLDKDTVVEALNLQGIQARPLWMPLSLLSPFLSCYQHTALPILQSLYHRAISLPCSVSLNECDQDRVITKVKDIFNHAA